MLFWTFYLFGSKLWRTGYMYVTSVTPFLPPLPFSSPSPSPDQNYDEQATRMSLAENAIVWWTHWHLIILRLRIIWPPSSTQTEWKKDGWRWLQSRRRPSSDGRVYHWFTVGWLVRSVALGLLGTGAQDVHLDFHTAPELCWFALTVTL